MFVESALVRGGLMSAMHIVYQNQLLWKFPPELWRVLTSFLLTGPDFSFVFDLYLSKLIYDQVLPHKLMSFSIYICIRTGAEFAPVQPTWRLFHLLGICSHRHMGKSVAVSFQLYLRILSPSPPQLYPIHSTSHICPPSLF